MSIMCTRTRVIIPIATPMPIASSIGIPRALVPPALLRFPLDEARKQHDKHVQKEQNHGGKTSPHAGGILSPRARPIRIDMLLDDLPVGEISPRSPSLLRSQILPRKAQSLWP